MEPEEETDDYADESFETGDSSPEKRKRSPVKTSRQQEVVHHPTPPRTQPPIDVPRQKSSVDKNKPIPSSVQELIRPCIFDPYNYDDDDEEDEDEKTHISLKLNPKETKVRKTKGKKSKVQQYASAETTTYARTEEENDRLVDELLEEYDLLPTKSLRTTKQPIETQPQGNKKSSKATAAREVLLDDNSYSNNSVIENTGSTLSRKGSLRKDPQQVATTAAVQQKTKVQPSRNSNSFVMPAAAVITEASIATTTTAPSMSKPTKRQPSQPQPQPPVPPPSHELQRIAVLEEREQALIEAVEDLSNQNDELIKKLQQSMANELQLELR